MPEPSDPHCMKLLGVFLHPPGCWGTSRGVGGSLEPPKLQNEIFKHADLRIQEIPSLRISVLKILWGRMPADS